ncbi:MAG: porin [Rhodocyclaceae bacterium]|nr:porin [Rhodocyclaceae bacterium]
MYKKLIGAAIAGLVAVPAMAQTNVTISGKVAAGWENYKLSGGGNTGHDAESRVSDQSSRLIFRVSEDLGGGLQAWGQVDMRYTVDLGALSAGGNTGLGLMSKSWGKFTMGRWDLHYNEFGAIESNRAGSNQTNFGDGIMSQVTSTHTGGVGTEVVSIMASASRTPNIVMWDSPNWNGFTARLAYSTNPFGAEGVTNRAAGDPGDGSGWNGALRYKNGPWTAGVSYWNATSENRTAGTRAADQNAWRAWLGYAFAMGLKVGFGWDRSEFDNHIIGAADAVAAGNTRRNAWMIPVSYSTGPHTIYFKYARAGKASGSAIAAGTGGDFKASAWNIGYDYAFSKRTSLGVYYTKLSNDSNGTNTVGAAYNLKSGNGATTTRRGEDVSQLYLGMSHSF